MNAVNRRTLLTAGALSAVGACLWGVGNPLNVNAATSIGEHLLPIARPLPGANRRRAAQDLSSWVSPLPPYSVTASVVMGEDYFLTDQVVLGQASDEIAAFTRNGQLEALVLTGNDVSHLRRDSTSPSGWSYTQLPLNSEVQSMAVGTDADGTVYALFDMMGNWHEPGDRWTSPAFIDTGGTWNWNLSWGPAIPAGSVLRANYDDQANLRFTAAASDSSFTVYRPAQTNMFVVTAVDPIWAGNECADGKVDFSTAAGSVNGVAGILLVDTDGEATYYGGGIVAFKLFTVATTEVFDSPWFSGGATVLYTDQNGDLQVILIRHNAYFYNTLPGGVTAANLYITGSNADPSSLSFAVLAGGQLSIIEPLPGNVAGQPVQMAPNVPILASVNGIAAPAINSGTQELFYIDATNLSVHHLLRDPATARWLTSPIHQSGQVHTSVDLWRTEITVLDANEVPVPGVVLDVAPDAQLDLWAPGGAVLVPAGGIAQLTTDASGKALLCTPVSELTTPSLTVTAQGLAATVISPDGDVHTYLAGGAGMNQLPPMTGDSLQSATDDTGAPVFPNLPAATANGAAAAISQAMTVGANAVPAPGAPQAFVCDIANGATFTSFPTPQDPAGLLDTELQSSGWWAKVKGDAESVYHGIRTGVIAVTKAAASYVEATADQAAHWLMNMAIAIGDDITDVIDLAITDLNSAVHFVSGLFHALGADISRAIKWLRAEITGLFTHALANADILLGWLQSAVTGPMSVATVLTDTAAYATGFFNGQKASFDGYITTLNSQFSGATLTDLTAPPGQQGQRSTGGRVGAPSGSTSPSAAGTPAHGNWLQQKLADIMPDFDLPQNTATDSALSTLEAKFTASDVFGDVETAAEDFFGGIQTLITNPKDFKTLGLSDLLSGLEGVVDAGFDIADLAVVEALDVAQNALASLPDLLNLSLDDIPLLSDLMSLAGISDTDLTLGRLMCLVVMFPATLANQVVNGVNDPLLDLNPTGAAVKGVGVALHRGLSIGAGVAQGLLAVFDTAVDLAGGADKLQGTAWGKFLVAMDIIVPAVVLTLTYPGQDGHAPFSTAVANGTADQRLAEAAYSINWVVPLLGIAAASPATSIQLIKTILPWVNTVFGLFLIVGGAVATKRTGGGAAAISADVLGNMVMFLSFCLTDSTEAESDGTSFPFKVVADVFANIGAGIALGFA